MRNFSKHLELTEETALVDMVYGEISVGDSAKMHRPISNFPSFSDLVDEGVVDPPPANDSEETYAEIMELIDIAELATEEEKKDFSLFDDKVAGHYYDYCRQNNLKFSKDLVASLYTQVTTLCLNYKYKYNRPRPKQVARSVGLPLGPSYSRTADSPAYPSGHACQSRFLSLFFATIHPQHRSQFIDLGERCARSRLISGLHYPSDSESGKKLAEVLFSRLDISDQL